VLHGGGCNRRPVHPAGPTRKNPHAPAHRLIGATACGQICQAATAPDLDPAVAHNVLIGVLAEDRNPNS
jgi:hypothetical protein